MKFQDNEVFNYVDQLKNYSTTNISGMQKGIVPEVVDINWDQMNYYVTNGNRKYVTYEMEGYVLRVVGIRYRINYTTKKNIDFDKRMTDAVNDGLVYPFMLFVNGYHVKWSTFRLVRNAKYTYIVCDNDTVEGINPLHITKVEIVNLPYTYMSYSEKRNIPKPNTELFRFDEDGKLSLFGPIVYSLDTTLLKLVTGNLKVLAGGKVVNSDLNLDDRFKMTKNNFLCWVNGLFDKTIDPDVKNLNIITMNNGDILQNDLDIKYFYRDVTNPNRSNITVPENKDLLKSLIIEPDNEMPQLDIKALGRDFDFKYKWNTTYEDNANAGIRYISRYNSAMFDKLYEKRLKIFSREIDGEELKRHIRNNVLSLPRGYHKSPEVFVIVYKEGELWDIYDRIRYVNNNFEIPITDSEINDILDYNTFEIVYFTGCNNSFLEVNCTEDNNTIENTTIKYDDLLVFANYTEDQIYKMLPYNKRTIYDVEYVLGKDNKTVTFTNPAYYGKTIYMAAKNQFKYQHFNITKPTVRFFFSRNFIPCLNTERFAVYHNGRLLSKDMYRVIVPDVENTATEVCVHVRRVAKPGDRVDIFYLPYDFNYTNIGRSNQVDVVTVRATVNQQPVFAIPFPSKSALLNKTNFLLLRGSVLVDQSRYNVIGRKIIFIDPEDYLDYGRELTFVFLYNKNIDVNPYGGVKEEDALNVRPEYVLASKQNQLEFDIPYPKDFNGFFFITYRGLYVNPNRYEIDTKTNKVRFFDLNTGIDKGTAVIFVFIYPDVKNKVGTTAVTVKATIENQLKFNIPLPYAKYFEDENSFFLIRNGVFLNDGEYYIDTKENTVELLTTEGLARGQELVFNFIIGKDVSVKTAIEEVRAEEDGQLLFKLPPVFHDFNNKLGKFFCVIGDTYIDNRRFEITGNDFRFLNREDAVLEGRSVTFIFAYIEEIDSETATIGKIVNTSKYAKFETQTVECTQNNQRTFNIPWQDSMLMDKKVIVTIGSTFIRESQYTLSKTKNTITFIDDSIITSTDRQITFTLVDSDYVVIQKELTDVEAVVTGQTEFDVPLPFDNYLKLGNSLMVFANQTFIDPSRYVIDIDNNKIMLKNYEDSLNKGQTITYLYFYIANQSNRSFTREDVQHPMINERGYLYLNRSDIGHMLNNKLYFMFINGKKINKENIMNVANNIIRIKADVQTRFNTLILDYTPSIPELDKYKNINSDYDIIMNQVSNEDINKLFNIYTNITDLEKHIVPDTSQEAIINDIIRTHCLANGVNEGIPFIYTYDTSTLKHRSSYGLSTIINKYIAPGKYTFTVPEGINRLDVKTICSSGRIKPLSSALKTLGYFNNSDFEFGHVSYILPTSVAEYIDRFNMPTTVASYKLPIDAKGILPTVNNFVPDIRPIRETETASTKGVFRPYLYQKEVIKNIRVYPGMLYNLYLPKNGFIHIAYNKINEDQTLEGSHSKYKIDFDSDRDSTPIIYRGDGYHEAEEFIDDISYIYSDKFTLDNKITYKYSDADYTGGNQLTKTWVCPNDVSEIVITLCSGYTITGTRVEFIPAVFQMTGFEDTIFSTTIPPKVGVPENISINEFYDRFDKKYYSNIFDVADGGAFTTSASDGTKFGTGIVEVGFLTNTDKFTIDSNQQSQYRARFNYLQENGVEVSISRPTEVDEVKSYIKVNPLETYTIYVAEQAISNSSVNMSKYPNNKLSGFVSISYEQKTDIDIADNNLYLSSALTASDDYIANPKIDYSNLNSEMKNSELASDPSVSHVVSDEEALQERDKPVFLRDVKFTVDKDLATKDPNQINIFDERKLIRK